MTLTINPDINAYLIRLFTLKNLVHFGMTNKEAQELVRSSPIYTELIRLKFDKHLYRFDSYDIIKWYYKHGMINLIAQYRLDHHRAVYLATKHGHLDLVKFMYGETFNHFPLARYCFHNADLMTDVVRATVHHHQYHIMAWFAEVGIVDNCLIPTKVLYNEIFSFYSCDYIHHILSYASKTCNLTMIQDLMQQMPSNSPLHYWGWKSVLSNAFAHGHIDILNWIITVEHLTRDFHQGDEILLDFPDKKSSHVVVLEWFWLHQEKIPKKCRFKLHNICLFGQLDILAQIYQLFDDSDMLAAIIHDVIPIGNLTVLQWLYDKDHIRVRALIKKEITSIIDSTIRNNQLHILTWLSSVIDQMVYRDNIADLPIIEGNIRMLEWLKKNGVSLNYTTDAVSCAVSLGYGHVIYWLHEHQILPLHIHKEIVKSAIICGHVHILEWIGESRIKDLALDNDTKYLFIEFALIDNRTDILKLFQSYQLIDDAIVIRLSAIFSDRFGIDFSDNYTSIRWLKEQYPMFDLRYVWQMALDNDFWHIVQWILHCYPQQAALYSELDVNVKEISYLTYRSEGLSKN